MARSIVIQTAVCLGLLTSCSSTPVYKSSQISAQFIAATEKTNAQIVNTDKALTEQRLIFDRLKASKPKIWHKMKIRAESLNVEMNQSLVALKTIQEKLAKTNGEFSSLSYGRPIIKQSDPQWAPTERLVGEVKDLIASFNQEMIKLENRHQQLQQLFQKHMAFQKISLDTVEDQFRSPPQKWRTSHAKWVEEFNQHKVDYDKSLGESVSPGKLRAMGTNLENMRQALEQVRVDIDEGDSLLNRYLAGFSGRDSLTSLDDDWPELLRLKDQLVSLQQKVRLVSDQFTRRQTQFKKLLESLHDDPRKE